MSPLTPSLLPRMVKEAGAAPTAWALQQQECSLRRVGDRRHPTTHGRATARIGTLPDLPAGRGGVDAMREYKGSEIRNIAVVGHGASGKTSLVAALAFVSGSSKRHGSVKDGTALTDQSAEEIERGFSINLG